MVHDSANQTLMMDIGQGLSVILGLVRIAYWDSRTRPSKAKEGTFGFNTQTNSLEYFNGKDWFQAAMTKV